jgi:hypothetical protein
VHLPRYATWARVGGIAAVAALATGVVLYFVEGKPAALDHAQRQDPPTFAVGPSGAAFSARF